MNCISRLPRTSPLAGWFTAVLLSVSLGACLAAESQWDNFSDTWTGVDALGRSIPAFPEVRAPRPDRTVGLFYFLWHGEHIQGGPFDVTQILAADSHAMEKPDNPLWGPLHAPHHWGQSIFGYYLSNDQGVLRKHAQMLGDAGVDVVIFDVTNQVTYRDWYRALLQVWSDVRTLGNRTPQVAFLTPFWNPDKVVRELWHDLYQPGLHPDLWFRWQGKPLIMADPDLIKDERSESEAATFLETKRILDFFTFRRPQPDYFKGQTKPEMWSWLESFPQHCFTNAAGQIEQMSVGIAQNALKGRLGSMSEVGAQGRSFHRGGTDLREHAVRYGLNAAEQWERALKEDPQFIFVTGWNEWIAGRFSEFNGIKLPVMFVDQFDQEHSRDIEPMRGGHSDDYYYQFVSQVRRFKGARPLPSLEPHPIVIDGTFDDWSKVPNEFRDTIGDPVHREHRGWDHQVTYRNHTGRNDLKVAKFSWDQETAWFYIRTLAPLTEPDGTNWMLLWIDIDGNPKTGWLGYDIVMNHAGSGSVERNQDNVFAWSTTGHATWRQVGNEMEVGIPWLTLGLKTLPRGFDFKWSDNCLLAHDWTDFTLNGDAAPNDRFRYRALLRTGED